MLPLIYFFLGDMQLDASTEHQANYCPSLKPSSGT